MNDTVECYELGTIATDLFRELQDVFRSVRADMGGIPLAPKVAEALYCRGLITHERNWQGRGTDCWIPSDKADRGLELEDPNGNPFGIEPRIAYDCRLVPIKPIWAE